MTAYKGIDIAGRPGCEEVGLWAGYLAGIMDVDFRSRSRRNIEKRCVLAAVLADYGAEPRQIARWAGCATARIERMLANHHACCADGDYRDYYRSRRDDLAAFLYAEEPRCCC